LVKNRPQAQVGFEVFERRLNLNQLHIELPQLGRVAAAQVAA
jgi:hypothetical protein